MKMESRRSALEPLKRPITIEDLLRHTSGITYGFYGDSAVRKLYASAGSVRGRFRQRAVRRAPREIAARRTAGNAVGLRPFDRYSRPRHRGGFGKIAVRSSKSSGCSIRSA